LAIFGQLCTISTTSTTFSTTTKQTEYQVFNRKSGGSGGNSNKKLRTIGMRHRLLRGRRSYRIVDLEETV
jgi:hypothetical protein